MREQLESGALVVSGSSMRRARSVSGPLRRAHPASGATWNVQVVRGKMSSQCLWHACRALSAGLLLMLLGAAMAVIGYYADFLSVDQEIRGNATVSVKDEARGFHLNNLSYVGPIVMGFGGFIVVAACVMTFEARDSAAKVTPARPTALPRPLPRRGPPCAPARLDQLGVYRLPHVLPLPHSLPLVPMHRHRPAQLSASAAESDCGSQSSLAMDLHASGACAGVTLRVRDNTRRRPLARQQRLRDDSLLATPRGSTANINNEEIAKTPGEEHNAIIDTTRLSVESELRASSAPPPTHESALPSPLSSPTLTIITALQPENTDTRIIIEQQIETPNKQEMERQTDALRGKIEEEIAVLPREVVLDMDVEILHENIDRMAEEEMERQIELQIMVAIAQVENSQMEDEDSAGDDNAEVVDGHDETITDDEEDNARALDRRVSEEVIGSPPLFDLNTIEEFTLEKFQEELDLDIVSRLALRHEHLTDRNTNNMHTEQEAERLKDAMGRKYGQATESRFEEVIGKQYGEATGRQFEEAMRIRYVETDKRSREVAERRSGEVPERQSKDASEKQSEGAIEGHCEEAIETQYEETTKRQTDSVIFIPDV